MPLLLFCFSLLFHAMPSEHPKLTIHIENIKVFEGQIEIGVFNTSTNFLKEGSAIKNYYVSVDNHTATFIIDDLPKGEYAISMYHDENSDGECNRNILGIPKEPYGFSNNIKPQFSAPSYKDCKFLLEEDKIIRVKLLR